MKKTITKYALMVSKYLIIGYVMQLFCFSLLLAGESNAQKSESVNDITISIELEKVTLAEAFNKIEAITDFTFNYHRAELSDNQFINYTFRNATVADVLLYISKQSGLRFKQVNNNINVSKRRNSLWKSNINNEPLTIIQTRKVTGTVTSDDAPEGLPGVNVILKGTNTGTITDLNGDYSIDVPEEGATLVFSSVGYIEEEITVSNQSVVNVDMIPDIKQLQDIVIVGFGERRKKDLTGSISSVDAEAIEKSGSISPQFALQGNSTGVRVVNNSGDPNEAPEIYVRGIGTWVGDSQPLYVIDGQIIEPPRADNESTIAGHGLSTPPNLWNLINPNDIESISVLKDASSAAIYGSRAANGVVLITTKKGKQGKPKLEFNAKMGVQNIPTYDMLNTQQYVNLINEQYTNNSNPDVTLEQDLYGRPNDTSALQAFNPQFDPQSPFYISDRTTYDWQDELVRDNAFSQSYDVKYSGANEHLDYYVSASYLDQENNLLGNNIERYTGAVNINTNLTDWLKAGINYKYSHQVSELNDHGELRTIAGVAPWQPLRDPSNQYGYAEVIAPYQFGDTWQQNKIYGQGSDINFLAYSDLNYRDYTIDRNLGQFYIEVNPLKGLTLRGSLNMDLTKQDQFGIDAWSRVNVFDPTGTDPSIEAVDAPNSLGEMRTRVNTFFNFQSDFTATYKFILGEDHNFNLTAAVQDQRYRKEYQMIVGQNLTFINDDHPKRTQYANDFVNNTSMNEHDQLYWFGYVGRLSYSYQEKYYLDGSFRRDGSNGFADEYQWGNFYSLSGAWRISSEPFMSEVPFLNDLKIRAGWGEAGNDDAAAGNYAFLTQVENVTSYRWGSGNGDPVGNLFLGSLIDDFANPTLSWEVATTTYAGFDALLFNNRLNFTFEWYNRVTDGILQRVQLPVSTGGLDPLFNIAQLENRGIDLMLGYNDQIGDFSYGISGNISFVENEVTEIFQDQPFSSNAGRIEEGRPIGHIWGYKVGGIFQSQDEIDAFFEQYDDEQVQNEDYVEPGDMYFQDIGSSPTDDEPFYSSTPDDSLINSFDRTQIGNPIPGYTYGINLNLGWKGLDLTMNFYGEGDVTKVNQAMREFESMTGISNQWTTTLDRWTPENPSTSMPRAVQDDPAGNNRSPSTRWVESAAFLRLNNWQLGYTLPNNILAGMDNVISSLRIYVGGQNNLYFNNWSGIDPVNDNFPLLRSYNFGLNAKF